MAGLRELERDVHQFLSTLANVRRVDVLGSVDTQGKKRVRATTYLNKDSKDARDRVYITEQLLMDRHRDVLFDFSCTTLKGNHESRAMGKTEAP